LVEGDERLIFNDRKGMQGKNQIFTKTGAVAYINEYYPFGLVNQQTSSTQFGSKEQRYKYNGKELFSEFKLEAEDYGARMYSPQIARWQRLDPMAVKYTSISPYVYVANNPLKFIDPDGEDIKPSKAFTNSVFNPVFNDLYKNNSTFNTALGKFKTDSKFNLTLDINNNNVPKGKAAFTSSDYNFEKVGGNKKITSIESNMSFRTETGANRNDLGKAILVIHEFLHAYSALQGSSGQDDKHQSWDNYLSKMEKAVSEYSTDNKLGLDETQIKELSIFNVGKGGDVYENYINSLAKKNGTDYDTERTGFVNRVNTLIAQ
jgi:RHS repeat-associated protein